MYTQCPECSASFRVTAGVLQQASGQVQCGGCGHAFNALERLSEEPLSEQPPDSEDENASTEKDKALLETLDEITGVHHVRIEDTGVEWRVLDEERYDDNTPLPGSLLDDDEEWPSAPSEPPRRRAEDLVLPRSPEFDERQVDLALGDPEDWTDLLDEVGGDAPADDPLADTDISDLNADDDLASDVDTQTDLRVLELEAALSDDLDPTSEEPIVDLDELELVEDGPEGSDDPVPPPGADELTIDRLIDQDLLRMSEEEDVFTATSADARLHRKPPPHVETIVMEGEFIRNSLEFDDPDTPPADMNDTDEPATQDGAEPSSARDDDSANTGNSPFLEYAPVPTSEPTDDQHARFEVPRYALVAGAATLALFLTAQVVHAWRETLATYGAFNDTVGSVYRFFGAPITPDWEVNSWQFQTPSGSTDASGQVLTISSTIANRSDKALPYPLLHVAVTDLYEEVIGERLLEPAQYLAGRIGRDSVPPGDQFSASVTIAPVSQEASGFKLNVCYRSSSDQVRCADGAFKD